jgi:hypothetical protein
VAPGTPCEPSAGCPYDYTCALVDGEHICVETPPGPNPDGGVDGAPVEGVWKLVQTRAVQEKRELEIDPSGAGNAIIVGVETSAGNFVNQLLDDAGNQYERINNSRARHNTEDFGIELWVAVDTLPGARRISTQGGVVFAVVAWEVAGIDGNDPVVAATRADNQSESTMPFGAPIMTDAPGQFVISIAIVANQVDGIVDGNAFTNDHQTYGNGWAHLRDPMAPVDTYTAQWVQPMIGGSCASSAAFRIKTR